MIELTNALSRQDAVFEGHALTLIKMVAPFAPHLGDELLSRLCAEDFAAAGSATGFAWPTFDPALAEDDEIDVPVQVNGKKRDTLRVPAKIDPEALKKLALESENVRRHTRDREPVKLILVARPTPKLINIVVRDPPR